MINICWNLP